MFYNKIVKKEAFVATYVIYIQCENICKYEYIWLLQEKIIKKL